MARRGNSIYHRKDGLWEARYVKAIDMGGKKKYGSVYARTYTEVKEKREEVVAQLTLLPQSISKRAMTLSELTHEWLAINESRLKPATIQRYRSFLKNHIDPQLGTCRVMFLTPVILSEFSSGKLKDGLSAKTINSVLIFIHTCLKYGNKQYGLPMTESVHLKQPKKEMRVLSMEEQKKLVSHLLSNMDSYKLGTLLALFTGIRIGELCALKWSDVDNGSITINKTMQRLQKMHGNGTEIVVDEPKSNCAWRKIPLPDFLIDMIESRRRPNPEFFFLSNPGHPIVEPRVMQNHFKKYISEIGIPPANFHALRHTFATRCVECGFEIKALSEVLGHSSAKLTLDKYVHASHESRMKNMNLLRLTV